MISHLSQPDLDLSNAQFWNELCGSNLARSLGIHDHSMESLRRFDQAYLRIYPYLRSDLAAEELNGRRVLEIGLGYGTVGQVLAAAGCQYYGLDIAEGPVALMRYRLAQLGALDAAERVQTGSALTIPHPDSSFDAVYSIGCLHHTGNLPRAISEVHRVLRPGGKALISLYNRFSLRRLLDCASRYDFNQDGEEAPHTEYVSRGQARRLFKDFRAVRVESRNCDQVALVNGRVIIPREKLLNTVGRIAGLDLYIWAIK